ncbi:MAG: TerC/Alx family metal homeostasis membrane protein [Crocinitomicaceae bacterium]|jgi:tellurite resistance protein TerC
MNIASQPLLIAIFAIVVIFMLALDLGVFNRKSHAISNKEAVIWSIVWISLSMVFSLFLLSQTNVEKFAQFQSAYWIEKALSVDNLFVFILVFGFFKVPKELHHKVLFWGIIGALFMRAIFIFSGVELINLTYLPQFSLFGKDLKVNVLLFIFGIFLVYAGVKSAFVKDEEDEEKDFNKSPGSKLIHRFFKVSTSFDGDRFFTFQNGVKMATPLLVVVAVIEFTDLLFAVDSIPAIFAIAPDDPFILYMSNIFAILGLRSLYFLLANFIHMFSKLKYGLAVILSFIGLKMIFSPIYHIDALVSLVILGSILFLSLVWSILSSKKSV